MAGNLMQYVLTILIPLCITIALSLRSHRTLLQDQLLGLSKISVRCFVVTRAVFWQTFGMLFFAFALAIVENHSSGAETRLLLAQNASPHLFELRTILVRWGLFLLPISVIAIFSSVIALFLIGRRALKTIPEDEEPDAFFKRARARFFFLGFSLIIPPLLFSLLLSI